ncbi:MAG TPA: hypothetical protein PLX02_11515 [Syntrophorhabdaceae bacterium]|jgi:hypothetical protein|nr:hypothetical protein [Syntrophorhabdaceae bacterium]HQM82240.1 hypothetical protein [Syntrophorhabdaceae bacterium]
MFKAIKSVAAYLRGDDLPIKHGKYKINLINLANTLHKAQGHDIVPVPLETPAGDESIAVVPASPGSAQVATGANAAPSLPGAFEFPDNNGNANGDPRNQPNSAASGPAGGGMPLLETPSFIKDVIEPYAGILAQAGAMGGISKIVERLDREGGCPSVVVNGNDGIPGTDYDTVKDIIDKVTLRSHTFRVARLSMEALRTSYGNKFENHLPTVLVAALGHDLGMLPSLRAMEEHANKDHPTISDAAIEEFFKDKYDAIEAAGDDATLVGELRVKITWLEMARKFIRDHHTMNATGLAELLREADGQAREMEIVQMTGTLKNPPWKEWFDARTYLDNYIRMEINAEQEQRWNAFSLGGVVYCNPELLFVAAKRYARDVKVTSRRLFRTTDNSRAIKEVLSYLRGINAVSPELGHEDIQKKYKIGFDRGKSLTKPLTPLVAEIFGAAGELDKTKEGLSGKIISITLEKQ